MRPSNERYVLPTWLLNFEPSKFKLTRFLTNLAYCETVQPTCSYGHGRRIRLIRFDSLSELTRSAILDPLQDRAVATMDHVTAHKNLLNPHRSPNSCQPPNDDGKISLLPQRAPIHPMRGNASSALAMKVNRPHATVHRLNSLVRSTE